MSNPNVTAITQYVDETRTELIAKSILGSKSADMFGKMFDVKGPATLNLIDTNPVLQAGGCGWNASGSTTLSQRVLTPVYLKVNHEFCPDNLLKTWRNHDVRVTAGKESMPFEQKFAEGIVNGVDEAVEKMIYQGQKNETDQFEGLISILSDDVPSGNTATLATGSTAEAAIRKAYNLLPQRAKKEDTVILVSNAIFDQYIQELNDANHKIETVTEGGSREMRLPGFNVKIVAVAGLDETATYDYVIAGRLSNIYYGCSAEDDDRALDFWYDKSAQVFKAKIAFIAGVQVAYPDEISLVKVTK
jgi:hypothetical protein